MNEIKLNYPIKLYQPKSTIFFAIICFILITLICYKTYGIAEKKDDLAILAISTIGMLMFACLTLYTIASLFLNKPTITITPSNIEISNLFSKTQLIFWSDIKSMELKSYTHRSSIKHWLICLTPQQKFAEKINIAIYSMEYNDIKLNQKEIFAIIEQSFKGERPIYRKIEMGLNSRLEFNIYSFRIVLVVVGFILMLIFI